MYQTFDAFEYRGLSAAPVASDRDRVWRRLCLSLGVSLLLPKRYTATASIVIEPPGGSDVRLSTAVSPVYLESLKTYERFSATATRCLPGPPSTFICETRNRTVHWNRCNVAY